MMLKLHSWMLVFKKKKPVSISLQSYATRHRWLCPGLKTIIPYVWISWDFYRPLSPKCQCGKHGFLNFLFTHCMEAWMATQSSQQQKPLPRETRTHHHQGSNCTSTTHWDKKIKQDLELRQATTDCFLILYNLVALYLVTDLCWKF